MNALAGQGIEIHRQGRHQGLALTGLHLGNSPPVEDNTADKLNIIRPQSKHSNRRLPYHGKGFGKQIIKGFTFRQTFLEFHGLCGQGRIVKLLHFRFQHVNGINQRLHFFQLSVILAAKNLGQDIS